MRKQSISVLGLYVYDNSLFDNMILPDGLDRATTVNNILMECSELDLLYNDPAILKELIGVWSKAEQWGWEHIYKLSTLDYNPIWNKDGEIIETETRDLARSENRTDSTTTTGQTTTTGTNNATDSATNTKSVKAYEQTDWAEAEKEVASATHNDTTSGSEQSQGTGTATGSTTGTDTGTVERRRVEQGNIGVTTTQAMALEEINLARKFSVYNEITKSFKRRFCLLIY